MGKAGLDIVSAGCGPWDVIRAPLSCKGLGWSPCSALGRLCGQINISHLFAARQIMSLDVPVVV